MKASDAEITDIPVLTKTEEYDSDKDTMKDIFKDDDISGLDLQFRRSRKLKVDSIEEYLKTLEFKPYEDGDCDENLNDPSKGFFKKNYKMKIVEETEEMSPTRESAKSTLRKNQFSSVSTKSNLKRQEETGMKLQLISSCTGQDNILNKFSKFGSKIKPAAIKNGNQLVFSEQSCQAKIFTTRQKITRVEEEISLHSSSSGIEFSKEPQTHKISEAKYRFEDNLITEFSPLFVQFQKETSETYSLPGTVPLETAREIFGIVNGEDELVLLEFIRDEELEGQQDLVSIHVCYPSSQQKSRKSNLIDRVEQSTRQDGYCSMRKFISKLLDVPLLSASPSIKHSDSRELEVKSLHLEEYPSKSIEFGEVDSRRKQSNSTGRKNSIVDMFDDQFFEEDSHYFQSRLREKVYQTEGSFSL